MFSYSYIYIKEGDLQLYEGGPLSLNSESQFTIPYSYTKFFYFFIH